MYYVIYDDFLPLRSYAHLKSYLSSGFGFPWNISPKINDNDLSNEDFYFATLCYCQNKSFNEQWNPAVQFDPFRDLLSPLNMTALLRVKCNMYMRSTSDKVYHHAKHIDYAHPQRGALFFLTNCNAPTTMADGYQVECKENRMLLFDAFSEHSSSSPTNAKNRMTININYHGYGLHERYKYEMTNVNPTHAKNIEELEKFG
tara:strand:- start:1063 stop:1665 length:603 start_codon:yes stop_codon:yes gene_type:complete